MSGEAWYTLAVAGLVFIGLVKYPHAPDVLLLTGVVAVALAGILTPGEAVAGFANEGMITVAALFVIAAAMRETGALDILGARILGRARTAQQALGRMALSVNVLSAFLNNTPIVAMMIPVVMDWCRKNQVSPSRLLIPLSHFTVLGGMCTLIGTSTNLVVSGLMLQAQAIETDPRVKAALHTPSLFEISSVGVPCAILGTLYLLILSRRLLPDRKGVMEQVSESPREYLVDMLIQPGCRLAGKSVEEAGLRHLPGLFLIEIGRDSQMITPVGPDEVLREGDRLTFTGVVSSVVELEKIPGLVPATDTAYETRPEERRTKRLCEAVISARSPLIGKTIRDANFRAHYNAAVVAVHRGGERITGRIGDIVLQMGDTLLLQTGIHFAWTHRNNPDFVLVSLVDESRPTRYDRAPISMGLLILLILLMVSGFISIMMAALVVALLMILTRCISANDARQSVDWQTLISIAAAFGMGKALERSGAAKEIAEVVVRMMGDLGPMAVLAALYFLTMLFTEALTNNAAAALMFPFALATAEQLGVSPRPFVMSIMFAATLAFSTPFGYQTNLMVYGPGGYRFTDFTRIGVPLNLMLWILAVLLIPLFWPFHRW